MKKISAVDNKNYLFWWAMFWLGFGIFLLIMAFIYDSTTGIIGGLVCIGINGFILTEVDVVNKVTIYQGNDYCQLSINDSQYHMVIIDNLIPLKYIAATFFSQSAINAIQNKEEITLTCKFTIGNKIPSSVTIAINNEESIANINHTYNPYLIKE